MDTLEFLEEWRYHVCYVSHGVFESMVDDFPIYQACYLTDQQAAIRFTIIILLTKQYPDEYYYARLI